MFAELFETEKGSVGSSNVASLSAECSWCCLRLRLVVRVQVTLLRCVQNVRGAV